MEAAEAAQLPTAHISHLQQARWFHTGGPWSVHRKIHDSPHKYGFLFYFRTYPCMRICAPVAKLHCQNPLDLNSNPICMERQSDYKEHLSPLLLETESAYLFNSKVNIWFYFRIFLLSGARKL